MQVSNTTEYHGNKEHHCRWIISKDQNAQWSMLQYKARMGAQTEKSQINKAWMSAYSYSKTRDKMRLHDYEGLCVKLQETEKMYL